MEKERKILLSSIPSIHAVLEDLKKKTPIPRPILHRAAEQILAALREEILSLPEEEIPHFTVDDRSLSLQIREKGERIYSNLTPVINATGVLLHTNLGRALLSSEAREKIAQLSGSYCNLEYDTKQGKRGSRYHHVKELLCFLCGAQSALVVNNNAAAILLILETFASGKEVIVSRGELIEIGGSFRLPDIMKKAQVKLVEVGTTNRTSLKDYLEAVGEETALILKSHQSNFRIAGFTREASLEELVILGQRKNLPVYYDMGSGNLLPFPGEPTVKEVLAKGIHLVSFSGDKLLGGPQAGIIVGEKDLLTQLRKNQLTRVLRVGKLTLAALEETLKHYVNQEEGKIPLYRALSTPMFVLEKRGEKILHALKGHSHLHLLLEKGEGEVGGGSLPLVQLESRQLRITSTSLTAETMRRKLLTHRNPIISRIKGGGLILDLLTIQEEELMQVQEALLEL